MSHLQVPLLVQKAMGPLSHTKEVYGKVVPTRSHPTTTLFMWQVQYAETIGWDLIYFVCEKTGSP